MTPTLRDIALVRMGAMITTAALGRLLVLVVVDLGELRVDDVILGWTLGGIALGLLVHRLAQLHRGLCQRIGLGLDRLGVLALERLLQVADRILDGAAFGIRDLRAVLG